ncbi:sugar kinase [Anaerotignum sp. MB30-C6]|uniref:sugar kinase n=1 Tax=Anaerotignum sp. MB30-C6 TaxID=3070814 RepID=UPI0027DBE9CD|nr:sugar kinase [Anaerotignum sp. MB30-C6]WMI79953.1 sugar kinase [Anaerotignum sp. MB30-C6]
MYDIITIGEILAEILAEKKNQDFFEPGGTLLGPFPSGAPAIAIDQAAKMGAKTTIFAKIGADDFGLLNKNRLKSSGVDISNIIETTENTTGNAFVTYLSDGSRKFIFHFKHAACGELCPDDINESIIKNSKILHIMGCSVTGSPSMCAAIMKSIRVAKKYNVKISFDPNIRPELLTGETYESFNEILESCDYLLTGKSELVKLFGDYEKNLLELFKKKDRVIVVKDGSRGTAVFSRTEAFKVDTYPAIEVDPTGAGDCFDGTFLALLCEGKDMKLATKYGNAAGALAVSKRGPMEGNSRREEIERLIAENPSIEVIDIENPFTALL